VFGQTARKEKTEEQSWNSKDLNLFLYLLSSTLKEVYWTIFKMRAFASSMLAVALGVNSFATAFLPGMRPKSYTDGMP